MECNKGFLFTAHTIFIIFLYSWTPPALNTHWDQVAVPTIDPMWDPPLLPSVVVTSRGCQGGIKDIVQSSVAMDHHGYPDYGTWMYMVQIPSN